MTTNKFTHHNDSMKYRTDKTVLHITTEKTKVYTRAGQFGKDPIQFGVLSIRFDSPAHC